MLFTKRQSGKSACTQSPLLLHTVEIGEMELNCRSFLRTEIRDAAQMLGRGRNGGHREIEKAAAH